MAIDLSTIIVQAVVGSVGLATLVRSRMSKGKKQEPQPEQNVSGHEKDSQPNPNSVTNETGLSSERDLPQQMTLKIERATTVFPGGYRVYEKIEITKPASAPKTDTSTPLDPKTSTLNVPNSSDSQSVSKKQNKPSLPPAAMKRVVDISEELKKVTENLEAIDENIQETELFSEFYKDWTDHKP
jgi:hypothetical protein